MQNMSRFIRPLLAKYEKMSKQRKTTQHPELIVELDRKLTWTSNEIGRFRNHSLDDTFELEVNLNGINWEQLQKTQMSR